MRRALGVAWILCATIVAGVGARGSIRWNGRGNSIEARARESRRIFEGNGRLRGFELPLAFEPSERSAGGGVQYSARGEGMAVGLRSEGMLVQIAGKKKAADGIVRIGFEEGGRSAERLEWTAREKLAGETNYLIGRDASGWRRHVPRYGRVEAEAFPGVRVAAYGRRGELEYDLRVAPGVEIDGLGLKILGAEGVRLDGSGDLRIGVGGGEMVMKRPGIFEEGGRETGKIKRFNTQGTEEEQDVVGRRRVDGGYVVRGDGSVGFWVGAHDAGAAIVIDPTLTLSYATFLGGAGGTQVTGVAVDAAGNLYVGGATAATGSFPGTSAESVGVAGASSYLFVAKMNPGMTGAASVEWLTFIGGSASQAGGAIAVDANGNVAIGGATTSADYPATDGSTMKSGANSAVVTEIDQATGAKVNFSSILGGSGTEDNESAGGVAIDGNGNVYIASDTTSTDLCAAALTTTPNPYQATYGGGTSDGFLAWFNPSATPTLRYCTYLGIFAEVGVTGLALDSKENAFLVGFTSQPINPTEFPSTANGFQQNYGGGSYDGFLVKIAPSGNGASDLSYATYIGGTGSDQAMAIAVDSSSLPATAYVVGTTSSTDFPMGKIAAYQAKQNAGGGGTNAFLAVVTQDAQQPSTGASTNLQYATYLGGSGTDQGLSVAEAASTEVFIAGSTNSTNFPWLGNLQPLNGETDAFVAELDPTTPGSGGLKFATPLGGTPATGVTATTSANAVAVMIATDGPGDLDVFVAGETNTGDFPQAPGAAGTGVELTCASCPGAAEGFVAEIVENPAGAAGPSVTFVPSVVKFANTGIQNYPGVNVAVLNTGDEALTISGVSLTQTGSDFSLEPGSPCSNVTLQPNSAGICSFEVNFTSTTTQTEGATIEVTDNAPGGTQVLRVVGASGNPLAMVTPGSLNFGNVAVGTASEAQYLSILNTGGQPLQVGATSFSTSVFYGIAPGTAGVSGGCTTIPAGGSCLFGVGFKPTGTGLVNGTLTITDNSGNQAGTTQVVTLSGTGVNGAPVATVAPESVNFGSQTVGVASAPETVTLTNTGSSTLDLSSVSVSGGAAGFAMAGGGAGACPAGGGTIAPGGSCGVSVTFTPGTSGAAAGSLNFFDNAGTGEQSVALSGTGASASTVSVTPTSVTFAPESVGTTSAATNVMLANAGSTGVAIASIGVTGTDAGDFQESNNCGGSVPAGKSCVIQVTFAPTATGSRTATLSVADNAAGSPQTVPLSGTGTQAGIKLSTASVTFSTVQLIGTASAAQTVTVSSTGTGALAISKITFPGTDAGDFSETDNCTGAGGVTIPSGQACTINIVFMPQAQDVQCGATPGARCATMTIADNAPGSPQTVALSGTVMDFEIEPPAGGSLAQTVTAGGTATYNLEIDSSGGFAGTVSLGCSEPTAITGTSCGVSAASVNVAANGAGMFTVSVPTTAAVASAAGAWKRGKGKGKAGGIGGGGNFKFEISNFKWRGCLIVCVAILGLLIGGMKQSRRRFSAAMLAAALAICASCGGGGGAGASDPAPTLPGTYTNAITVTATTGTGTGAASRTVQLTLIVQ